MAATTQETTEYNIKDSHQHTRTTNTATSAPASHKTLITDPGRSRRAPPSRPAPLDIELSSLPFAERASSHDPSHPPPTSHTSTTPSTYLLDGTPATGAPASYPTTDEDSQPLFPPQQHPPDNRGLAARLRAFMKDAYFPLLRSSPAVGTGSYGAVPVSYQGSGATSEEDLSEREDDEDGVLRREDDPRSRVRRRRPSTVPPEVVSSKRTGAEEEHPESGDEALDMEEDEDDYTEDENDPPDNSPYPEVRASVLATDDLTLSINTPRMWTLSLLFTLVGSATNLFFSLRYPSISITPVIALLLAHPLGKLWDQVFPGDGPDVDPDQVKPKGRLGQLSRWLGQGKWNRKEHACVYISSNVSFGFAFATDVRCSQLCLQFGRGIRCRMKNIVLMRMLSAGR